MYRNKTLLVVATCLFSFFVLTLLGYKTRVVDPGEHERYANLSLKLRLDESRLAEDVLRTRFNLLSSYDPIVRDLQQLKSGATALETSPHFLSAAAREQL